MMGETEKQKAIRALFPSVAGALARGVAGRAARRAGGGTPGWGWDEQGGSCGRCKLLWQHHPRREGERGPVSPPALVPVFSFAPSKLGVSAVGLGSRNLCSVPARPPSGCSGVPAALGRLWAANLHGTGLAPANASQKRSGRCSGTGWGAALGWGIWRDPGAAGMGEGDLELREV